MLLTRCRCRGREQASPKCGKPSRGPRDALLLFFAASSDGDEDVLLRHTRSRWAMRRSCNSASGSKPAASSETRVFVPFLEEQQRILADAGGSPPPNSRARPRRTGPRTQAGAGRPVQQRRPGLPGRSELGRCSVTVDEHPELLTCTADESLNDLLAKAAAERPDMVEGLGNCRDVLADACESASTPPWNSRRPAGRPRRSAG